MGKVQTREHQIGSGSGLKIWMPYIQGGSGTDTFTRSLAEALRGLSCEVHEQPIPHRFQYAPFALRRLAPPPGTQITTTNSWNGFAFARHGIPMVTICHLCVHDPAYAPYRSLPQSIFHRNFVKGFERLSFQAARATVSVSEATARAVREVFPHVDPVVIRNGIDTSFFTPGRAKPVSHRFRLLFVGNLTPRKGADLLEPVLERLGNGFELHYTSGLRDRGALTASTARALGSLGRVEVRDAYRAADAFLFPTRLEGLPLTVMEAMACGLPIVASNRSSIPELVTDGKEGLLCEPEVAVLSDAVRSLADNKTVCLRMSEAARHRAAADFDLMRMARDYRALFEKLI